MDIDVDSDIAVSTKGVLLLGVCVVRALLFGVCTEGP